MKLEEQQGFVKKHEHLDGWRWVFEFPNGYGVSLIKSPLCGGDEGLYEMAVLKDSKVCYDTSITDNVLKLTEEEIVPVLEAIKKLKGE